MTVLLDRLSSPTNGAHHPMTAPQRQPLQTGDLWRSVDRLTKDRTHRLIRDIGHGKRKVESVPIPSLYTQLAEALASSNSSDGRPGKSTGSRSPLDLAIEALLTDMSTQTRAALLKHGGRPRVLIAAPLAGPGRATPQFLDQAGRPLIDPELAGRLTEAAARAGVHRDTSRLRHDVKTDLRQLATVLTATHDQDLVDRWAAQYHSWTARAEDILTGDDESIDLRGIRGHACPHCHQDHVVRLEPSADPRAVDGVERFHDPALVIAFRDGQVQHITCRACDAGWWRGGGADELGDQIRAQASDEAPPSPDAAEEETQPQRDDDVNHGGRLSGRSDDWWPWPDHGGSAA